MKLTQEERIQGLLDMHARGMSRAGVKVNCELYKLRGAMTELECDAAMKLIDEQEATKAPVSVAYRLAEVDTLRASNAALETEVAALKGAVRK